MCFSPTSYALIVTASMLRIEVNKSHGLRIAFRPPPDLAEHSDIGVAHQYLPQHIQAMCCVDSDDVLGVYERAFPFGQVVIIIPMQGFPEKVLFSINQRSSAFPVEPYQAVKMM